MRRSAVRIRSSAPYGLSEGGSQWAAFVLPAPSPGCLVPASPAVLAVQFSPASDHPPPLRRRSPKERAVRAGSAASCVWYCPTTAHRPSSRGSAALGVKGRPAARRARSEEERSGAARRRRHRCLRRGRRAVRRGRPLHVVAAVAQEALGEPRARPTSAVWSRSAALGAVPRRLLRLRAALRGLRHRDGLPVSVGGHLRPPDVALVRLRRDGRSSSASSSAGSRTRGRRVRSGGARPPHRRELGRSSSAASSSSTGRAATRCGTWPSASRAARSRA